MIRAWFERLIAGFFGSPSKPLKADSSKEEGSHAMIDGDEFIRAAGSWVGTDGIRPDDPRLTPDKNWLVVCHPQWWAAREAFQGDKFPELRNGSISRAIVGSEYLISKIASEKNMAKTYPWISSRGIRNLIEWARPGRISRHDCGAVCEYFAESNQDRVRQDVYTSASMIHPWRSRFYRDVVAAMLDTAPKTSKNIWLARSAIVSPGGGSVLTMLSIDGDHKWIGQTRSISNANCSLPHEPISDSCTVCDRTDAEFWADPGDGLA